MEITIHGPTFYDQEDENVFFSCIYSLPGYKQVRGHGSELTISFDSEVSDTDIIQLLVICRRWFIAIEPLIAYKNSTNEGCYLWKKTPN